jgi:hypothetical protein
MLHTMETVALGLVLGEVRQNFRSYIITYKPPVTFDLFHKDGYIMSYQGWGTKNKFYFSSCSQSLMANFIK